MAGPCVPADNSESVCPACGATIRSPASSRRRRVQCPKCREVVIIGESVEAQPAMPPPPAPPSAGAAAPERERNSERDRNRLEALEARVSALEEMLKSLA